MLIIGVGNRDRGDDAAGILVVRRLAERGIKAIEHCRGMLDLIEIWQTADCIVIVDAVSSGADPGTVHIWNAHSADFRNKAFPASTHAFGLADAIELARTLDQLPASLTIYGIEAVQFVPGTPPSPEVLAGVQYAADHIASHTGCCSFLAK